MRLEGVFVKPAEIIFLARWRPGASLLEIKRSTRKIQRDKVSRQEMKANQVLLTVTRQIKFGVGNAAEHTIRIMRPVR